MEVTDRVSKIERLFAAMKVRELSLLAAIKTRRESVESLIDRNRREIHDIQVSIQTENAIFWKFSDRRLRCLLARNQALNVELAGIAAEMEIQKLRTAKAVGKHDAFNRYRATNRQPSVDHD